MQDQFIVEMREINKSFGGIHAIKNVSLEVKKGEVHALVGENGAGKSTLMKVLSGAIQKDSGEIRIGGQPVDIHNSHDAKESGVSIIYQEFALASELTVAENIFLGEDISGKKAFVKWNVLYKKAQDLLDSVAFRLNPKEKVKNLSVAYQQMTEIAKALNGNVKILILDEPTAVLGPQEAEKLFEVIKTLKESGVSIIYISHRMEEIFKISDRISVLKDGQMMGTKKTKETSLNEIITLMIGREMGELFPKRTNKMKETVLEVKNIARDQVVKDVSFTLKEGEILGVAGLIGAGKTETMRLIFGADKKTGGEILLEGEKVKINSPVQAVKQGISYVPENRKEHGVLIKMPTKVNITMPDIGHYTGPLGIIKNKEENKAVWDMINQLEIKVQNPGVIVENLSGGNQQKVSLAKWISINSKVIILDEPTRGVDVGAKIEIYKIIQRLANEGMGVIFISSEMMEVIGMSDRVLVMHEGEISGELNRKELSEHNIMKLAVGQKV